MIILSRLKALARWVLRRKAVEEEIDKEVDSFVEALRPTKSVTALAAITRLQCWPRRLWWRAMVLAGAHQKSIRSTCCAPISGG
jgi:hypothetical protein